MKQRKQTRRPTKKFKSSFAGKRNEQTRRNKPEKPAPAYINRVSKAGKQYRVRNPRADPNSTQQRKPVIPLRLTTTPAVEKAAEQCHREQRQANRNNNKQQDRVNKLLILNHLTNRTTSKQKILKIVGEINSRGLRQRLLKKVNKAYS